MNFQLKSLNQSLHNKVDLFLSQATITDTSYLRRTILDYVAESNNKYVLFRHSSLYFFANGALDFVEETIDNFNDSNYLRFDGEKVSRIDPEYYLGPLNKDVQNQNHSSSWGFGYESGGGEWGSNNNNNDNNNNNNNGNNG